MNSVLDHPLIGFGGDDRCPTCGQPWPQDDEPAVCCHCGERLEPWAPLAWECLDTAACIARQGTLMTAEVALWL